MDGFRKLPKMQHFKEGGSVKVNVFKEGGKAEHEDIAEDKKLIKKAFKQHDEAEHDKEPTEIKLRKGGRSGKEKGTVRKFKAGGFATAPSKAVERPAKRGSDVEKEAGKPAGDKDPIKRVKAKDLAAAALSAAGKGDNTTALFKCGGKAKKMADGGLTDPVTPAYTQPIAPDGALSMPIVPGYTPMKKGGKACRM